MLFLFFVLKLLYFYDVILLSSLYDTTVPSPFAVRGEGPVGSRRVRDTNIWRLRRLASIGSKSRDDLEAKLGGCDISAPTTPSDPAVPS